MALPVTIPNNLKVWFPLHNSSDTLMNLFGVAYPSMPVIPVGPLLTPAFWNEANSDGQLQFCTTKVDQQVLIATFMDAATGLNYTVTAKPYSLVNVNDTTPTWRPE